MTTTILVAEDDPDDLFLVTKALGRIDDRIHIKAARNGREVLEMLQSGLKPAAVLLDLNMPVVDGREVLTAMQTMRPASKVPVIVLTTSSEAFDQQQCLRLGACGYISKPATIRGYVDLLNGCLVDHIGHEDPRSCR